MNKMEIKKEYLDLIIQLNKTNKLRNEPTELIFSIRDISIGKNCLTITANLEKYLSIGSIDSMYWLNIDPDFQYQKLAEYIKKSIPKNYAGEDLNSIIQLAIRRLFEE